MLRIRPHLLLLAFTAPSLFAQAPSLSTAIPNQSLSTSAGAATVNLQQHFTYTGTTGPLARFETVMGDFDVELLNTAAPKHVENFTKYANERLYDRSFIHRSTPLTQEQKTPAIIQGGGYFIDTSVSPTVRKVIPRKDPVALEYSQANVPGTLAAARTADPNSATSEWFFNILDNTTTLGPTNGGGYTAFGKVLGTGMQVLEAIAALPRYAYSQAFATMPLRDYTGGPVTDDKLVVFTRVRVVPIQPSADGAQLGILRYSATTSSSGVVGVSVTGSTLTLTPHAAGTATVTVTARDARSTPVSSTFTVQVSQVGPVISQGPASQTIAPGGTATFTVQASGSGTLTYQWRKNDADIAGATGTTLTLNGLTEADAGDYRVAVTDSTGTTVSAAASLDVSAPNAGSLTNLSVRAGSQPLIVGFVTAGSKEVLLRAAGPSLTQVGITNPMADPTMNVHVGDTVVASNNDWGADAATLSPLFSAVGAFAWSDTASKDAALTTTVSGPTTAVVRAASGATGVVLAEVYALPGGSGRLINVSGRGHVGTGANVLIAGFAISGNVPKRVLVRAVGPTLGTRFEVTNVLANPVLELHRSVNGTNVLVATNDDWGTNAEVVNGPGAGSFPLDAGSADSALLLTLSPGVYTALVRGLSDTTGEALVEVYEVP